VPGGTELEELDRLRRELSSPTSSMRSILDRLSRLDMVCFLNHPCNSATETDKSFNLLQSQDVAGRQLRSRNTFLQILLRRSRDLLALDSPGDILED